MAELNFGKIEKIGQELIREKKYSEAIGLYVCLCDGDDYFEAGYYAYQISICFENIGNHFMAKYWAGLAVSQNPNIEKYVNQRQKFSDVNILNIVSLGDIT